MMHQIFTFIAVLFLLSVNAFAQGRSVCLEAEAATDIGSEYVTKQEGDVVYLTPTTNTVHADYPGNDNRVLTYTVSFLEPGSYHLYIKLRVGSDTYNDDSFFYGNGFGQKTSTLSTDWVRLNGIGNGSVDPGSFVLSSDKNPVSARVFKWINVSLETGARIFLVEAGSLTRTIQIGAREDGLDMDKIAFAHSHLHYTVEDLESGGVGLAEIPDPTKTLMVDVARPLRPTTQCAIGSLYGMTETLPANIDQDVLALNPYVFVQPAMSGVGYQQPFGDAFAVSERLEGSNAKVMIRLSDVCPYWPYRWPGTETWMSLMRKIIEKKQTSGRSNYYGYEIWNERHGTWITETNGDFYTVLWKPTYDLIRSLDPEALIVGPSDSYYRRDRIQEFLEFCIANHCVPDVMCWHELIGAANITNNIQDYRSLERSLGLDPLPLSINEYCHPTHENEGCPGTSAPFIAKFERNLVDNASISWWFTNLPGRLGSLLTSQNQRGGGWLFYKWYGAMTGNMLLVTPPNEASDGLDGFACYDDTASYVSLCFGGNSTGSFNVLVRNLPDHFGSNIRVRLERVVWENKDTPVSGIDELWSKTMEVVSGTVSIPIELENVYYGYRLMIEPEPTGLESMPNRSERSIWSIASYDVSTGLLALKCSEPCAQTSTLSIHTASGTMLLQKATTASSLQLDVSLFEKGIYLLRIQTQNQTQRLKFIKN